MGANVMSVSAPPNGTDSDPSESAGFASLLRRVAGAPSVAICELSPGAVLDGKFRIERVLGRGGMGVVYLAHHIKLSRRVAVKLTRGVGDNAMQRLLREARAMASITHEHVVTVYDVGAVDEQVFIAMEFVDGGTTRSWLAEGPRSWKQILELHIRAGRGLAAAHDNGLVHRDFKPDNVLVGVDGRVRVADFGLARVAPRSEPDAPSRAEASLHDAGVSTDPSPTLPVTASGVTSGTPAYMALEQFDGGVADARSDQFAFCVTLFEALYGRRPFEHETQEALVANLRSDAVLGRAALAPNAVPGWAWSALAKGLRARPEQRWPSMTELLAVLDPSRRTRRRNLRGLVAVTGAAGLAVGATFTGPSDLCVGVERELEDTWGPDRRARVLGQLTRGGGPASTAMAARVVDRVDAYAAQWVEARVASCSATRVQQSQSERMLDAQMGCLVRAQVKLNALVGVFERADADTLSHALAAVYGLARVRDCNELDLASVPAQAPDDEVAALIAGFEALLLTGQYDTAAGQEVELRARAEAAGGDQALEALYLSGELQLQLENYDLARRRHRESAQRAYAAGNDRQVARSLTSIAWISTRIARVDEGVDAANLAESAIHRAGNEAVLAGDLALARLSLAMEREDAQESDAQVEVAMRSFAQVEGKAHLLRYRVLSRKAIMHARRGESEPALAAFTQARDLALEVYGPQHPVTAKAVANLGTSRYYAGDIEGAVEALRLALEIKEAVYGEYSPALIMALNNLGSFLQAAGDLAGASAALARAQALATRTDAEGAVSGMIAFNLANIQMERLQFEDAQRLAQICLAKYTDVYGEQHTKTASAMVLVGVLQRHTGDAVGAERTLRGALSIMSAVHGEHYPTSVEPRRELAQVLLVLQRPQEAAKMAALALKDAANPAVRPMHAPYARYILGHARYVLGNRVEGLALVKQARDELGALSGAVPPLLLPEVDAWVADVERATP